MITYHVLQLFFGATTDVSFPSTAKLTTSACQTQVWVLYVFHENTNTLRQPKSSWVGKDTGCTGGSRWSDRNSTCLTYLDYIQYVYVIWCYMLFAYTHALYFICIYYIRWHSYRSMIIDCPWLCSIQLLRMNFESFFKAPSSSGWPSWLAPRVIRGCFARSIN